MWKHTKGILSEQLLRFAVRVKILPEDQKGCDLEKHSEKLGRTNF